MSIGFFMKQLGPWLRTNESIVNANILEGEKFKRDVGVQAIRGSFGERELENSVQFLVVGKGASLRMIPTFTNGTARL